MTWERDARSVYTAYLLLYIHTPTGELVGWGIHSEGPDTITHTETAGYALLTTAHGPSYTEAKSWLQRRLSSPRYEWANQRWGWPA